MASGLEEYREHLVEARQKAHEDLDKTLISLSGGALAVSFAFLDDVVGKGPYSCTLLLFLAWVSWGLSVVAVLVSYFTSQKALDRAIEQVDKTLGAKAPGRFPGNPGGWATTATVALNGFGVFAFLAGTIFMATFAYQNLGGLNEAERGEAETSTTPTATPPHTAAAHTTTDSNASNTGKNPKPP